MKEVFLLGRTFSISVESYTANNTPAITLYTYVHDEGGMVPWIDLTTNIHGASTYLEDGECLVKTWSENEEFIQPLLESGLFEDTGRRVPCGFAEAHIWKMGADLFNN